MMIISISLFNTEASLRMSGRSLSSEPLGKQEEFLSDQFWGSGGKLCLQPVTWEETTGPKLRAACGTTYTWGWNANSILKMVGKGGHHLHGCHSFKYLFYLLLDSRLSFHGIKDEVNSLRIWTCRHTDIGFPSLDVLHQVVYFNYLSPFSQFFNVQNISFV